MCIFVYCFLNYVAYYPSSIILFEYIVLYFLLCCTIYIACLNLSGLYVVFLNSEWPPAIFPPITSSKAEYCPVVLYIHSLIGWFLSLRHWRPYSLSSLSSSIRSFFTYVIHGRWWYTAGDIRPLWYTVPLPLSLAHALITIPFHSTRPHLIICISWFIRVVSSWAVGRSVCNCVPRACQSSRRQTTKWRQTPNFVICLQIPIKVQ